MIAKNGKVLVAFSSCRKKATFPGSFDWVVAVLIWYDSFPDLTKLIIMKGTTKVALGIVGALAAGVAIGLLVAPEKGSKTRKRIRKTAEGWVDQFGNMISRGEELANDIKESVMSFKQSAGEKMRKMREGVTS